jgi:hypothetical protein
MVKKDSFSMSGTGLGHKCLISFFKARPTFSVEKLALFSNSASGSTFSSTAIEIINKLKFAVAKARVFPHLGLAWVCVGAWKDSFPGSYCIC